MRKNFILFLAVVNLVALPLIFFLNRRAVLTPQSASLQPPNAAYGRLPDFSLTERSGQTVTAENMKGGYWIINFIFTSCPSQCPLLSSKFELLQRTLPAHVRLASFSVDPQIDTPEKLSAYAETFHADKERWLFLTGEKKAIREVLSGLHLGNGEDPAMHSVRFVLLDPKLQVLGYYDPQDSGALADLKRDIQKWAGHP